MTSSTKIAPPGLMELQEFRHLAKVMRGISKTGPLPYSFDEINEEVDRERIAAICYVVNSVWLAPESERNPNSSKPRFAARAFEIMNPTDEHTKTADDERYWSVAFVSNYPIGEEDIPRISSALHDYDFDFHVAVTMRSHIKIRAPGISSFGVGLVVRIEKHDWEAKKKARQQAVLIEENKKREEEMLQYAFSDPTSVVCLTQPHEAPRSTVQRFSVSSIPPQSRYEHNIPGISNSTSFKPTSQQRTYRTNIAERYKAGLLGRAIDFVLGIDPSKI